MKTDSTMETAVVTSAMSRTASGRWRAQNMISSAPTNGDHVMTERTGNGIMTARPGPRRAAKRPAGSGPSPEPPLREHEQQEGPERDAVDVVLGQPRLQTAHPLPRPQGPRTQHVQHAVHQVAVDPADESRDPEQHDAIEPGVERVEAVAPPRHPADRAQRAGHAGRIDRPALVHRPRQPDARPGQDEREPEQPGRPLSLVVAAEERPAQTH